MTTQGVCSGQRRKIFAFLTSIIYFGVINWLKYVNTLGLHCFNQTENVYFISIFPLNRPQHATLCKPKELKKNWANEDLCSDFIINRVEFIGNG